MRVPSPRPFSADRTPSHGPSGCVADTLDEAKAAFRSAWGKCWGIQGEEPRPRRAVRREVEEDWGTAGGSNTAQAGVLPR
jgi:hypothetical protein